MTSDVTILIHGRDQRDQPIVFDAVVSCLAAWDYGWLIHCRLCWETGDNSGSSIKPRYRQTRDRAETTTAKCTIWCYNYALWFLWNLWH